MSAKFFAFAACVFPAMSADSYGVAGVLAETKARGRVACGGSAVAAPQEAPPSVAPPCTCAWYSPMDVLGWLCAALAAAAHHVAVVLSCGLYGRGRDGSYERAQHDRYDELYDDELAA